MQRGSRDPGHEEDLMMGGGLGKDSQVLLMPCLRNVLGEDSGIIFITPHLFSFYLFCLFPRVKI